MSIKMPTLASGHSTLTVGRTQRNHPLELFFDSERKDCVLTVAESLAGRSAAAASGALKISEL
jgi:hypothetical protein